MTKRIATTLTQANIRAVLDLLTATPDHLAHLSAGCSPEDLRTPLGAGERSLTENLAHLINCEALASQAIYLALLLNTPLLHNLHAERDWGNLLHHERYDFRALLAYFRFRRTVLLDVLHALTEAQWARHVREEGKQRPESVYWQARGMALHELAHLTDLEGKLGKPLAQ